MSVGDQMLLLARVDYVDRRNGYALFVVVAEMVSDGAHVLPLLETSDKTKKSAMSGFRIPFRISNLEPLVYEIN